MCSDKNIEQLRYEQRAKKLLTNNQQVPVQLGSQTMPATLRSPYEFYEQKIRDILQPGDEVLELGAGCGEHTLVLAASQANVMATDLSDQSLQVLQQQFAHSGYTVNTKKADIEELPFDDNCFDVIACAGSLSYGEPATVDREILRVLKPKGVLVLVDSLNHNPIYRFNRLIHFLKGRRTMSTLKRMPTLKRINGLEAHFSSTEVNYFGSVTYIMPLILRLMNQTKARQLSDRIDRFFGIKRSAFKFVLVAKGLQK